MNSIPEFIDKLEEYIIVNCTEQFYSYTRNGVQGALLIKNNDNNNRTIFKSYSTNQRKGLSKIQHSMESTSSFKGHKIDNYVFVAPHFRNNSKRYTLFDDELTLLEVNFYDKTLSIYGSKNIDKSLFEMLLKFSQYLKFGINYDFKGILTFSGEKDGVQQVKAVESKEENPSAFFSYSWDNEPHKHWVLKLAADLIKSGIKVLVDEWDLSNYKNDINVFMESGIRECNYVIMVCTPNYAQKANNREGGVGTENTIITGEYYDEKTGEKYIPIVKDYSTNFKESLPTYLKTKYAIDFKDDSKYKQKFDELLRRILKVPKFKRPELGTLPKLESEEL